MCLGFRATHEPAMSNRKEGCFRSWRADQFAIAKGKVLEGLTRTSQFERNLLIARFWIKADQSDLVASFPLLNEKERSVIRVGVSVAVEARSWHVPAFVSTRVYADQDSGASVTKKDDYTTEIIATYRAQAAGRVVCGPLPNLETILIDRANVCTAFTTV